MPANFAANYTQKFSNIVKKSNRFYRFTRFCFGFNDFLNKSQNSIDASFNNPKQGICKALDQTMQEFEKIKKDYNWLSRNLLGFNSLNKKLKSLHEQAIAERTNLVLVENATTRLKQLKQLKRRKRRKLELNVLISHLEGLKVLNSHLEEKQAFINSINLRTPNNMPHDIEIYGRNRQIRAYAKVSGGKPMTYGYLKAEHKKNVEMISQYQQELLAIEKNRYTVTKTWSFDYNTTSQLYDGMPHMEYDFIQDPNYETNRERASNNLDGCDTTKRYVEGWINELSTFAPRVCIDKNTKKPKVEYPYESSLFSEARKKSYTQISVWESETQAQERKKSFHQTTRTC